MAEKMCEAERIVEKLKADGWKENVSEMCCVDWVVSSMLLKSGEIIKVRQDLRPDEDVIEQECGTGRGMKADDSARKRHGRVVGNFELGECFCDVRCRYGHETRLFNIGRGHYVACDRCRRFVFVGSNLMSSWRKEDRAVWRENGRSIEGYEEAGVPG